VNICASALSWWILLIILPFACASTDRKGHLGVAILQWSTALGFGGLFLGNMLSSFLGKDSHFHLIPTLFAMGCLLIFVFLAMFKFPGGGFWVRAKFFLIADVILIRIGFGYITPLVFRDIARKMPSLSEKVGRLVAIWTQIFSMIMNLTMFISTKTVFRTRHPIMI